MVDKPTIERVYAAFHAYHVKQAAAMRISPVQNEALQEELDRNTKELRVELEKLGLAQHIQWDPGEKQ